MSASQLLVELVLQVFWAFATACTTDIGGKTREWMIQCFDQAYFRTAKQHRDLLLMLEQPGRIVDQLTESDVMSEEFERWLTSKCFKQPELPEHIRLLGHVARNSRYGSRTVGQEKLDELCDWLQRQHKPISAIYKHRDSMQYLHNCKKYVAELMKIMLDKSSFLTKYRTDYECMLTHFAGKAVLPVSKPRWDDLEASVRLTVVAAAHQAVNQGKSFPDCFDCAIQTIAPQPVEAKPKPAIPAKQANLAEPTAIQHCASSGDASHAKRAKSDESDGLFA